VKEKCKTNSRKGKIIQTKSVTKLCGWDPGNDVVVFLCPKVFSVGPLFGCMPRELLMMIRLPGRLFNQWDSFLHSMESLLLDHGLKHFCCALSSNQRSVLYAFWLRPLSAV